MVLLTLMLLGFILMKLKAVPAGSPKVLSRAETYAFIPALVFSTFSGQFTREHLSTSWMFLVAGIGVALLGFILGNVISRLMSKDEYKRNIICYGMAFSNFGFVGNAVMQALYPEYFANYLLLVVPSWIMIYVWGVPIVLMPHDSGPKGKAILKNFLNPMFIMMILGILTGIFALPVPTFILEASSMLKDCMSPVAMLLTGMIIAEIDIKKALLIPEVYVSTVLRLLVIPILAILILRFVPAPLDVRICALCAVSMPLGLNSVVIPEAYGRDTTMGAGMALVSHVASLGTIPLIFMLFGLIALA